MKIWTTLSALLLLVSSGGAQTPQVAATTETYPLPFKSYSGGKFDHIQLQNGTLTFRIPLFSIPQLGRNALSYSLLGQAEARVPKAACDPNGGCAFFFVSTGAQPISTPNENANFWGESYYGAGAFITHDQAVMIADYYSMDELFWGDPAQNPGYPVQIANMRRKLTLRDGTGGIHQMGYDSNDYSLLHATDGSGWTLKLPIGNSLSAVFAQNIPWTANPTAYDSNGISYELVSDGMTMKDPIGNAVVTNSSGVSDGLHSTVPPVRQNAVSTSGCPSLGISDQQVASSYLWSVPGPNGSPSTYRLCYTTFALKTNFWGADGSDFWAWHYYYGAYGDGPYMTVDSWSEMHDTVERLQSVILPDGTSWKFIYDTPGAGSQYTYTYGDFVEIRTPEGGLLKYQYTSIPACGEYASAGPYTPKATLRAVTQRIASAGSGPDVITSFVYDAMKTTETTAGNVTEHIFTSDGSGGCGANETTTKFWQGSASTGSLLKQVDTAFHTVASPQSALSLLNAGPGYSPPAYVDVVPTQVTTQATGQDTATVTYGYETLFTDVEPVYYVQGNSYSLLNLSPTIQFQQAYQVTDSEKSITSPSYFTQFAASAYKSANLLTLKDSSAVRDLSGVLKSSTVFHYDEDNGSPQGVYGNLTSADRWTSSSSGTITTSAVYNSQGMLTQSIDPRGTIAKVNSFQCSGLFPASITLAFGTADALTTSEMRDCNIGALLSTTDPNGVATAYDRFDPLGRVTAAHLAVGKPEESQTAYFYPTRTQINVAADKSSKGDGMLTGSASYDGLGRPAKQVKPGFIGVDTAYDNQGNIGSITNPYVTTAPGSISGYTSFLYDALGRKTVQCNPDNGSGSTCTPLSSYQSWTYAANYVESTDESGKRTKQHTDALGRLADVYEDTAPGGLNLHTQYGYDVLGNLTSVAQDGVSGEASRGRSFIYDSLSRLLSATNPESGTVTYSYTRQDGSLCSGDITLPCTKTDARGVAINYSYDALNRLVSKTYSNDPTNTPSTCYQYNSTAIGYPGGNFLGRLTHEWTQSGACASTLPSSGVKTRRSVRKYDPMGRVKVEERCVLSNCTTSTMPFSLHMDYDLAGNLTEYDNGIHNLTLSQSYDSAGRLNKVTSSAYDATHPNTLYNVSTFFPNGVPSVFDLGLHLNTTQGLDNRLRPTTLNVVVK